jgi:tRNA(Arg) A34 adenosine deaminase TadA
MVNNITEIVAHVRRYLTCRLGSIESHTAQEYFTVLLGWATRAAQAGDFGISAALVVQYGNVELISLGRNTAISLRDPFGHAEINAIKYFRDFQSIDPTERASHAREWTDTLSILRSADHILVRATDFLTTGKSTLYTTLEPCPMCTVAIMNAGIERVIIASSDEPAGTLAPDRLSNLPAIWPRLARQQNLEVVFADTREGSKELALTTELQVLLRNIFEATKDQCHAEIISGVLFDQAINTELPDLLLEVRRAQ